MGGRAEGLACADPGARTPIGASGNYQNWSTKILSRQPDQLFPARHINTISVNWDLTLGRCGFLYRAARIWNLMPPTLRDTEKQEVFKTGLRKWIMENIPRKPP